MRCEAVLTTVLLFALAPGAAANDLGVAPRRPLTKVENLEAPMYPHRLVVKFRDDLRVRRTARGGLKGLSAADRHAIRVLQRTHGVSFDRLLEVPEKNLEQLRLRARGRSRVEQPDLGGLMIAVAAPEALADVARALNQLDVTEYVYFQELTPEPPCSDHFPTTLSYNHLQTYFGPNPGLNMTAAWDLGPARGAGVRIADCEYGFNQAHEDLCGIMIEPGQTIHPTSIANGWDEHGTAVLAGLVGLENGYGVTGLVPEAEVRHYPELSVQAGFRRATAIANAIGTLGPGDVLLLEMQVTGPGGNFGPAEIDAAVWTLVRAATDAGITVVAAAGNGAQDLDSAPYQSYRARGDSGAIIVGAGDADTWHGKQTYSSFGSRVNVQAWGENVFTAGYGNYVAVGNDKNQRYISQFGGTSSATFLVAAAAASVQSMLINSCREPMEPAALRDLLIQTGVPQGGNDGHIGPMPDVAAAITAIIDGDPALGDCNDNGVTDACEFASGVSDDDNGNGIPDECEAPSGCSADTTGDGMVNIFDLITLILEWGPCQGCPSDINQDAVVDIDDVVMMILHWGPCE